MAEWNYADVWEAIANAVPDSTAQVHGERRFTWGELDRRADGIAATLLEAAGAQHGDKVLKLLEICAVAETRPPRLAHAIKAEHLASGRQVRARSGAGARAIRRAGLRLRELEWNDARNGSKNLHTAPPRRRPHACVDPHTLRFAAAPP